MSRKGQEKKQLSLCFYIIRGISVRQLHQTAKAHVWGITMTRTKSTFLALLAALLSPMAANATFITDAAVFDAANPGLTLLDFEGICGSGTCAVPGFAGVTFSGPNLVIADGPTFGAPTDWLADNTFGGFISMAFAPGINAIGFNVTSDFTGAVNGQIVAEIFSGATLLDSQTFTTTGLSVFDTFAGWSGLGILDNVSITLTSSNDFVNIDNLRFGITVPEPGTLALLGIGLAGMGLMRRRKKA